MNKKIFLSPAKINLFFALIDRRLDGYHEIVTLIQAVNLFDTLSFEISSFDHFDSSNPSLVSSNNLVLKARDLFRNETKQNIPLKIFLKKNIPIMAGLGGGSSNAATTLFALNEIHGFPLSLEKLKKLGKSIGADVNFFFSNGTALCTGIGEIVQDISIPDLNGFIAFPNIAISTKDVFKKVKSESFRKKFSFEKELLPSILSKNFDLLFNDLTPFSEKICPKLIEIEMNLEKMFKKVLMSGSGSSFVCLDKKNERELKDIHFFPFLSIKRKSPSWYTSSYDEEA